MAITPDKKGRLWMRFQISDMSIYDWYLELPKGQKARLVQEAIDRGRGLVTPALHGIEFVQAEMLERLDAIETQLQLTGMAAVEHREDIDELTHQLHLAEMRIAELENELADRRAQ